MTMMKFKILDNRNKSFVFKWDRDEKRMFNIKIRGIQLSRRTLVRGVCNPDFFVGATSWS